jgi:hypothetical protein
MVLAMLLGAVAVEAGQTATATTGAVNGTVTDSSKALLPGVAVSLSGASLMVVRTARTDAAGAYRFAAVPPGEYTLIFEVAGFSAIARDGIRVGVGFTATVDVELQPGSVVDSVHVGGAPVVDLASNAVTTRFDARRLAELPGARDIFAVLAATPGVAMAKMDVGGNGALALQEYTAYGLRATTGMHRNEVEGIRVGGANAANDNYFSDFGSFSEIAVEAVGHSAAMPVPGTLARYVSKSGGDVYRGRADVAFQSDAWAATNIDDDQIRRGLAGGPGLDVREVNRLQRFGDVGADVGGYVKRDVGWWYGAYRQTDVRQRYAWLLDAAPLQTARVATGKVTLRPSSRQSVVGYLQHETYRQSSFFVAGTSQPVQTSDALPTIVFPVSVWKGEYNAVPTDALFIEVRVGSYASNAESAFKSTEPRVADVGANTVRGGAFANGRRLDRPQLNGSVSFTKSGWFGHHTFRVGGEYVREEADASMLGYGHPCNCVSTLNNGVPAQVQLVLGSNVSSSHLVTSAGFADDTWRISRRVTLSLGVRLDRYQPVLPEQRGPAGQAFAAVDPVLTFRNWGPRVGASIDLTGHGKTVLKLHYGKFWLYPGAVFTSSFNPNPFGWSRTYLWTTDGNGNGRWDPGEQGPLLSVTGGSASSRLDAGIVNTHVQQATAYLEREVVADFAVRTGFVLNARRNPYGTINASRPLSAYAVPVAVVDPGPDGRLGSGDDGGTVTAFNLTPEALGVPPVNLTTNLADSASDYYTWEITATKHQGRRWFLLASFTRTWHREPALGTGSDFTPNALINATGGRLHFTTWQAKVQGAVALPGGVRALPIIRSQSGMPFGRTFVRTLNYGNATIKAEPVAANRTSDILLADLRTEKAFSVGRTRVVGFVDVYNIFNTNAEQTLTASSGAAWLRPTAITGPRTVRIGTRLDW